MGYSGFMVRGSVPDIVRGSVQDLVSDAIVHEVSTSTFDSLFLPCFLVYSSISNELREASRGQKSRA